MKTLRNITLMAALLIAGSTFAQETSSKSKDALKKEAMEQTNDLDAIVNLTEEQRSKVFEVFVAADRQEEALEKRMVSDPDKIDQAYIDRNTQNQVSNEMLKILTAEQYDAYKMSLKK